MKKILMWSVILFMLMTSCRTIPKITPFVDASLEIRKGTNAGFGLLDKSSEMSELRNIVCTKPEQEKKLKMRLANLDSSRILLKGYSKIIDKSLSSITAYSGALNNLSESSKTAEKNAQEAAKNFNDILSLFVSAPIAKVVGLIPDEIVKIKTQIDKVRIAKKIINIMDESKPVIESYTQIFQKIIDQSLNYNESLYSDKTITLVNESSLNANLMKYQRSLEKNNQYIDNFNKLALISQFGNAKNPSEKDRIFVELKQAIDTSLKENEIEQKRLDFLNYNKMIESEKLRIHSDVEKILAIQKQYDDEYNITKNLFVKLKEGIVAWKDTHQEIRNELDKKSPPDFVQITEIVEDIKTIREKLKTLNP